jgi:DNA-binding transcriptional MerR regulator
MAIFDVPTFPSRTVVHAARIDARTLRHLTGVGGFPLTTDPARNGREKRRFAPLDVARLAIVARLLDCGLTCAEAVAVVAATVDHAMHAVCMCGLDFDAAVIRMRTAGMVAYVAPTPNGPRVTLGATHADAALFIAVGNIVSDALGRLADASQ